MRIIKPHTICRIFGHSKKMTSELGAVQNYNYLKGKPENHYKIVEIKRCARCGEELELNIIRPRISRAELVKIGFAPVKK